MQQSVQAQALKDIQITNQITERAKEITQLPQLELQMLAQDNEERQQQVIDLTQDVRDLKQQLQCFQESEQIQAGIKVNTDEKRACELCKQIDSISAQVREKMRRIQNLI